LFHLHLTIAWVPMFTFSVAEGLLGRPLAWFLFFPSFNKILYNFVTSRTSTIAPQNEIIFFKKTRGGGNCASPFWLFQCTQFWSTKKAFLSKSFGQLSNIMFLNNLPKNFSSSDDRDARSSEISVTKTKFYTSCFNISVPLFSFPKLLTNFDCTCILKSPTF